MISSAQTCAPKQTVGARDGRCLAIRAREVLIYKEIASWAARNAFPNGRRVGIRIHTLERNPRKGRLGETSVRVTTLDIVGRMSRMRR
jgi:hypothetical protein